MRPVRLSKAPASRPAHPPAGRSWGADPATSGSAPVGQVAATAVASARVVARIGFQSPTAATTACRRGHGRRFVDRYHEPGRLRTVIADDPTAGFLGGHPERPSASTTPKPFTSGSRVQVVPSKRETPSPKTLMAHTDPSAPITTSTSFDGSPSATV